MSNVTRMLDALAAGDRRTADELFAVVYDELRQLAASQMAREKPGQTLDATALVHEAFLRLIPGASPPVATGGSASPQFATRGHFFAAAAEAMRRILVDRARARNAEKRGGGLVRQPLDSEAIAAPDPRPDLLAIDEALSRLATIAPRPAELVKLRYFAGLTIPQAAEALGISPRTADGDWAYAKAWLFAELRG